MADQSTPYLDERGNVTLVAPEDLPYAQQQGWKSLSDDDLSKIASDKALKDENKGTLGAVKSAAEAAGEALTFGFSDYAEKGLGVDPNAIRVREELHPFAHAAGTALGVVAPLLLSGGASAAEEAPGLLSKVASYTAPGMIARVGEAAESAATRPLARMVAPDIIKSSAAEMQAGREAYEAAHALPGAADVMEIDAGGLAPGSLAKSLAYRGLKGAAGGATEGALYGAGDLVHESALNHPPTVGSALGTIGLSALFGGAVGGTGGLVAEVGSRVAPGLMRVLGEIEDKGRLKALQKESAETAAQMAESDPTAAAMRKLGYTDEIIDSYRNIVDDARAKGWVGPTSTADSVASKSTNAVKDAADKLRHLAEEDVRDPKGLHTTEMEGARFINGLRKIAGDDEITLGRLDEVFKRAGITYEMRAPDLLKLWDTIQSSDVVYDPHYKNPLPFVDLLKDSNPKLARTFGEYAQTQELAERIQRIYNDGKPPINEAQAPVDMKPPSRMSEALGGLGGFVAEHAIMGASHTLAGSLGFGALGSLIAHAIKRVAKEHGAELAGKLAGALKSKVENWPASLVEEVLLNKPKARMPQASTITIGPPLKGSTEPAVLVRSRYDKPRIDLSGSIAPAVGAESASARPWDQKTDPLHDAIVRGEPTPQTVGSTVVLKHYEQDLQDHVDSAAKQVVNGPKSKGRPPLDEEGALKTMRDLQQLSNDPEDLVNKMTEATSDLRHFMPNVSDKASETMITGINYLQAQMPHGAPPSLMEPEGGTPNKADLYKFQMQAASVMDPLKAIEDYGPHPIVMSAIAALGPEIIGAIREAAMAHIKPQDMSYQQIMAAQQALGMTLVPASIVPLPPVPIGDSIPQGIKSPRIKGLGGVGRGSIKGVEAMAKATRANVSPYRRPFGMKN